jgi:hypothetical protein
MDTKHKQITKFVNSKGEEKTYMYDNQKYYQAYKAKNPQCLCDKCGAVVLGLYINRHQVSKRCITNAKIREQLENN